ncbi:MAG: response regulator transcription factor [Candidatus Tectomicrobia bacterium]|uniref:Response regulator transcription factor n=1 Tax=Tectimicrobiota bacterium TaxID=2528274 RepID=A0A932GPI0_UNCTE|nr:response regulator transcription factor [Candidatus Tectomicrobia bacterium]
MGNIKVLIVDGHEKVRQELTAALGRKQGLEIVGAAATGQEALRQVMSLRPDLVLLDVKMDDGNGVETCRRIAAMIPMARVVVLTSYFDETERNKVLSAGACAYLLKEIGAKQLIHALRALGADRMAAGEGKDDGM